MNEDVKFFSGIALVVIVIIVGVILYSRAGNSTAPGASVQDAALLVRPDSQSITATSSKVTVVEFGDYQCPACGAAQPIVSKVLSDNQGKINFVFRNFPLPQHQYAIISAEAAEIAGDQGKFWQMHDRLYAEQDKWVNSSDPKPLFIQYAKDLGLNVDQFTKSLNANKYADKIQRDLVDGTTVGVNATPTFFVNGVSMLLNTSADLQNAITKALQK